jgi:D-galactarolactone cycloisomerase
MATIERLETFVLEHRYPIRRGPSIALGDTSAYILVKLTDSDGVAGWGETYLMPGAAAQIEDLAPLLLGRDAQDATAIRTDIERAAQQAYVQSAIAIAVDDLRARERDVPIYTLYGGPTRTRVRAYAAMSGYIENVDPAQTWPDETEQLAEEGFTAIKMRIGRYPLQHEGPLYEIVRRRLPPSVDLMADGNAGYTFREAVQTGRALQDLGFLWFEEPLNQWDGYLGYERLNAAMDIPMAGGEVTMSRGAAIDLIDRGGVDIYQPEPVICGGIGEAVFIAEMARLNAMAAAPHTSGSGIGIASAIQAIACLQDPTRLPLHGMPLLEIGTDPSPWRLELFGAPIPMTNGWVDIPTGPGLGFDVDEAFVRRRAKEVRVAMANA